MQLRLFVAAGLAVALIIAGPTAALAAAPSNDTFGGATEISSLPFSETLDTTEATTDADDAEASASCWFPVTEASVWYSFTPADYTGVTVDVGSSDFQAGVIVVSGSPGSFLFEACGDPNVAFVASAGVTYHIVAFDLTPGDTNGGSLQIDAWEVPLPELNVTIDPVGHFDAKTGAATVTGTFTCSGEVNYFDLYGNIRQKIGRVFIEGFFDQGSDGSQCDGAIHTWSGTPHYSTGKFAGGKATVWVYAEACSSFCSYVETTRTITLKR